MIGCADVALALPAAAATASAQTGITRPPVDEPTTIGDGPAEVGLEGDCGCRPWWYRVLLGAGGLVLPAACYATCRSMRRR